MAYITIESKGFRYVALEAAFESLRLTVTFRKYVLNKRKCHCHTEALEV